MTAIILSVAAVVLGIVAIVIAAKNKRETVKEIVVEKKVVYAPVEHPFTYNEEVKAYRLDGSLYAEGFVCALDVEDKKKEEQI